jgi:hypothetical protein
VVLTYNSSLHQKGFCPYTLCKVSVLTEPFLGHLCWILIDVPPQPNSPPKAVFDRLPKEEVSVQSKVDPTDAYKDNTTESMILPIPKTFIWVC